MVCKCNESLLSCIVYIYVVHYRLKAEVEGFMADPSCVLPDLCDLNKVEKWLLKLRYNDLCSEIDFSSEK